MPYQVHELVAYVEAILQGNVMPDTIPEWEDGTTATPAEMADAEATMLYICRERMRRREIASQAGPRRKAYKLLRRLLSPLQQEQLRTRREFYATSPKSGKTYRFCPSRGTVEEVALHGTRYFVRGRFCIHPEDPLPPADVTISQLLLLSADEDAFWAQANYTDTRENGLWDGAYLRRLRAARVERLQMQRTILHAIEEQLNATCGA